MAKFAGAIGVLTQSEISGLVHVVINEQPVCPQIILKFENIGTFAPTQITEMPGGWINFSFLLPPQFQQITWQNFLDEFVAVLAVCPVPEEGEYWPVPLHKSLLTPINRTSLHLEKLRDYSLTPKKDGKIAAFTIAYNEYKILPIWANYYVSQFGAENVYVIDQGSDKPYDMLPAGVTVVRVPREEFDNWLIARVVATFQRFLLESYDAVLYSDSDEFVCAAPEALASRSLAQFLLEQPNPVGVPRGYNLHHDILREAAYDPARSVLSQRRFITRHAALDKPLIARVPLSWIPGFHKAKEGGVTIPGLYLLHLRYFDLDAALTKSGYYRNSKWNPYDLSNNLGFHQLVDESTLMTEFRERSARFAVLDGETFDPEAETTSIPSWMRDAIAV
jgi:hypothetical protein